MLFFRYKIVRAGSGRSHTVVVTDDGISLAFGWNKHGQLGSGSVKNGRLHLFFSAQLAKNKMIDIRTVPMLDRTYKLG